MKSKKDRENETLSLFCGALVFVVIVMVVLFSVVINLAIDQADKTAKTAIEYSKRVL